MFEVLRLLFYVFSAAAILFLIVNGAREWRAARKRRAAADAPRGRGCARGGDAGFTPYSDTAPAGGGVEYAGGSHRSASGPSSDFGGGHDSGGLFGGGGDFGGGGAGGDFGGDGDGGGGSD